MNVIMAVLLGSILSISLSASQSDKWQQSQSQNALRSLDCEFEDCTKKSAPKVIVKEKIVYRDRPVEKVVVKEKIVYRDAPVKEVKKKELSVSGRTYNKLYLDISVPGDATFISDYVQITNRAGGADWNKVKKMLSNAPKDGPYTIKVSGMIEIPQSYSTKSIYIKPRGAKINKNLIISGKAWDNKEMVIENNFQKVRAIPFYYKKIMKKCCVDINNFYHELESEIPNMSFVVSKKPEIRGEKKNYVSTKVFVEE